MPDNNFLFLMFLTTIGSFAGMVGGIIFLAKKGWAKKLSLVAVPFAAGVLLSVSLLHLLPEAEHELGELGYLYVLLAFLGSFIFEQFFANLHHHEDRKNTLTNISVPLVVLGDTIHNFIDGVTIAAAYLVEPRFGVVVTLATFLHETPHEIGDFGVLMASGWSRTKTFVVNALSASATFPGAIIVFFFMRDAHSEIAVLLAISAGIFLYLGASDFLPEVGEGEVKGKNWKLIFYVLLGSLVMYLLSVITPEH